MLRILFILLCFSTLIFAQVPISEEEVLSQAIKSYEKHYGSWFFNPSRPQGWFRNLFAKRSPQKEAPEKLLKLQTILSQIDTNKLSAASLEDWFFFLNGHVLPRLEKIRLPSQPFLDSLSEILKKKYQNDLSGKFAFFADLKNWNESQTVPHYFLEENTESLINLLRFSTKKYEKYIEGIERWEETLTPIVEATQKKIETALTRSQSEYQKIYRRLKYEHFVDATPEELLAFGEKVFQKTWEQMEELATEIDPKVSLEEQILKMKQFYPQPKQLIETCKTFVDEALAFIQEKDLVTIPKKALNLKVVEVYPRNNMPYAYYQPHQAYCVPVPKESMDPKRLKDYLGDFNFYRIAVIALHEAYPGHHLQYSKAIRSTRKLHKNYFSSVYVEGWGLYCEEMMHRHGYYQNPLIRLAQLKMRLWRAARVILDIKIHVYGTSVKEAATFLETRVFLSKEGSLQEAKRYLASPTQPLSYLVGYHQINTLRDEMKKLLGAQYSEKDFHDQFLSYGILPIKLVRLRMLQKAKQQKKEN